jgi:hypothetical protein
MMWDELQRHDPRRQDLQRQDVRAVLLAAADVIFSDGVSDAFIDQWTDETLRLLAFRRVEVTAPAG